MAMVYDPVILTLTLLWLCGAGYKDDVDNAKELFKFVLVDEATRSFQPPKPEAMRNMSFDYDDIDVQICDDDDVFGMVNVGLLGQDIKSKVSAALNMATLGDLANEAFALNMATLGDLANEAFALNMATLGDLANEAFKEWISLKVD
jgi:hypothetical protein